MKNTPLFRKTLLVDKKLQFDILWICLFISFIWVGISLAFYFTWTSLNPEDMGTTQLKVLLIAAAAFVSVATLAFNLSVTNRIAGPIYRMRNEMKRVAEGGSPKSLEVRNGDMLVDLYEEYNRLVGKMNK